MLGVPIDLGNIEAITLNLLPVLRCNISRVGGIAFLATLRHCDISEECNVFGLNAIRQSPDDMVIVRRCIYEADVIVQADLVTLMKLKLKSGTSKRVRNSTVCSTYEDDSGP